MIRTLARGGACLVLALVAPVAAVLVAQTAVYEFNGVTYAFPTSRGSAGSALTNDGSGGLTWESIALADVVTFSTSGTCPDGWVEYTALRGRYAVGLGSSGTVGGAVGTALTNLENRSVGQHTHSVTDPGHTHTQDAHSHTVTDPGHRHSVAAFSSANAIVDIGSPVSVRYLSGSAAINSTTTGITVQSTAAGNVSATTGITVAVSGSVLGTNAPYLQLLACRSGS